MSCSASGLKVLSAKFCSDPRQTPVVSSPTLTLTSCYLAALAGEIVVSHLRLGPGVSHAIAQRVLGGLTGETHARGCLLDHAAELRATIEMIAAEPVGVKVEEAALELAGGVWERHGWGRARKRGQARAQMKGATSCPAGVAARTRTVGCPSAIADRHGPSAMLSCCRGQPSSARTSAWGWVAGCGGRRRRSRCDRASARPV